MATIEVEARNSGRGSDSRARRLLPPALVAGGLGAMSLALHFRDPHAQGSWGMCPTAAMGFSCPGCGGLRAVNDLTNFQILDAASSNLAFVLALPLIAYAFARWVIARWKGVAWNPPDRAMSFSALVIVVGLVAFTVLRNTAAGSWLAP